MSYYDELLSRIPFPNTLLTVPETKHICEEIDRLRADVALATDTIKKCNAWIAEAKPLLERGGEADHALASARTAAEQAQRKLAEFEPEKTMDFIESLCAEKAAVRKALERALDAINAGFGKEQRDHIIAQGRAALALPSAIRGGEKEGG